MAKRAEPAVKRRVPRGSIALLAGFGLPMLLILAAGVASYAFLSEGRRRLQAASDGLALTYAEQGLVVPQQFWAKDSFAPATLAVGNGLEAGSFQVDGPPLLNPEAGPGRNQPDAWAPAFFQVHTRYSKPALGLGSLITNFIGTPVNSFDQYSQARLNQLHLSTFLLARERVMFLLDYSKTMRLNYEGSGASSGLRALDVMRSTGAEVIQHFQGVFDVGVLLFSDGGTTPGTTEVPVGLQKPASGVISQSDQNNHIDEIVSNINSTGTMGNGTDIANAVNTAVSMLKLASSDTSSLFSNQRIVLITDGEPESGEGVTATGYQDRVQQAIGRAQIAVDRAWADGITTDVVYMQREQKDREVGSIAAKFLSDIAGKKGGSNKDNYKGDAGDPGAISTWLQSLAVYPVCESVRIDTGIPPAYNVARGLLPGGGELLKAYFEIGLNGYGDEIPIRNIFIDQTQQFLEFVGKHGAVIAPDTKNVSIEALRNSDNLAILYSSDTRVIRLSPIMCAALQSTQNNAKTMRLRLRWGSPRTVPPNNWQVLR